MAIACAITCAWSCHGAIGIAITPAILGLTEIDKSTTSAITLVADLACAGILSRPSHLAFGIDVTAMRAIVATIDWIASGSTSGIAFRICSDVGSGGAWILRLVSTVTLTNMSIWTSVDARGMV